MVSIEEIKSLVLETISLEKQLRAASDFRGNASSLYLKLKNLVNVTQQNFGKDEETRGYADKVRTLIDQRIAAMERNNEFNPVAVAVYEKTELDLLILEKHLQNEDFKVRLDAVAAVEELKYAEALPKLIPALKEEKHLWVVSKLVKVIAMYGGVDSLEIVSPYLENEDDRVRANCVEGIASIDNSDKYPFIMKALEDPSNRVRANALNALKTLGGKEFIALIKQMVNSPSADVRHSILFVLKNMKNALARDSLFKLLKDQDSEIQRQSATLLGKFNDLDTVELLTETVKETQSQKLKDICIKSLGQIRQGADASLQSQINNLIKASIAPQLERQQKEKAVAVEIKKGEEIVAAKAMEAEEQRLNEVQKRRLGTESNGQAGQPFIPSGADADLLAELASFSEPGDISPSRVASGGKDYGAESSGSAESAREKSARIRAENLEKEQDALKKIINRMNTALKQLSPRIKLEAEKQIKMGKIKNDSQLKIWLSRVKGK